MLWQNKNTNYSTSPVDDNHLLSKINKYIDLSFTHQLVISCYNSKHGRPSIDPEIFFRMLLISYFYNINSDRRLCQEVRYNVAYRWFCKLELEDKVPDHSYFSKTRNRFGEKVFEALFTTILNLCKKHGLLESSSMMTDSTLIKANASLNSLTPIEAKAAACEKAARKAAINKLALPQSRSISNSTHISKTDKDSSLAKKEGSPGELKYKIHNSIDALSRVIIDTYVTSGKVHDSQVYIERLNHIREKYTLTIKEAIADRAYGSREIIEALQRQGIVTYIPLFSTKSGKTIQEAYQAGFVYEKEKDRFVCPEGRYLNPYESIDIDNERKYYRSNSSDCAKCVQKEGCSALSRGKSRNTKYLIRNLHQELFDKTLEAMQKVAFISKLKERMWKIEGIFAEAKQLHGLSKARYRGVEKVQIQAYMVASVQNVKRLIKHLFYAYLSFLNFLKKYLTNTFSTAQIGAAPFSALPPVSFCTFSLSHYFFSLSTLICYSIFI